MNAKVNYNDIMQFKKELEDVYYHFTETHKKILRFLEDAECIDDEKIEVFHSYIKEYESKLENLKSDFYQLSSENKKLESCLSQVKLLKKKRMTKIASNMKKPNNHGDLDSIFGDDGEEFDLEI